MMLGPWHRVGAWLFTVLLLAGCQNLKPLPDGLVLSAPYRSAANVEFFADTTWIAAEGKRQVQQQIFDEVLERIAEARELIVLDMFLYNDFLGQDGKALRPLSSQLTEALLAQKQAHPEMRIVMITDPVNTVYGGLPSEQFDAMRKAGVEVVMTDLEQLHDSNVIYSSIWRLLIKPFGNSRATTLPNPFGEGRVSLRSYLRLLNFKANHRKTMISDVEGRLQALVTSANPHDGSSAHRNVALGFEGEAVIDLLAAENAVLSLSGASSVVLPERPEPPAGDEDLKIRVLTESAIEQAVLQTLASSSQGDRVDLLMFYLSDRHLIKALKAAAGRGVTVRLLLDPNKDAFGLEKNGIPNRPVARELVAAGIPVRWCDTHGEQCHGKMFYLQNNEVSTLILGSANYTRRNLHDFNLEANVLLTGPQDEAAFDEARQHFEQMWGNGLHRIYSLDYDKYADESWWKGVIYRFQEFSGMSTF